MHNIEGQSCAYVRAAPSASLKLFCKVDYKSSLFKLRPDVWMLDISRASLGITAVGF